MKKAIKQGAELAQAWTPPHLHDLGQVCKALDIL
jgi:hypothetical protein